VIHRCLILFSICRNEAEETLQRMGHGRCTVAVEMTLDKPCQNRGIIGIYNPSK